MDIPGKTLETYDYNQMNLEDTLKALSIAIDTVLLKDKYLLHYNVSERAITHKLAEYFQPLFHDFNVDCEYNRDIDNIAVSDQ